MQGVLVSDVEKGSPGAAAGFRRGIVITHVGGEEFQSMDQLAEQLAGIKSGDMVSMAVFIAEQRGGFTLDANHRRHAPSAVIRSTDGRQCSVWSCIYFSEEIAHCVPEESGDK